jgi:hypothetical protein
MKYLAVLLFLAGPFWESSPPAEWSETQVKQLLTDSPWAQIVQATGSSSAKAVQVLLETAEPIQQGEAEWNRRFVEKKPGAKAGAPDAELMRREFELWLSDNRATQIVLAISAGKSAAYSDEHEIQEMEKHSLMIVGHKKYKMTGHFPPDDRDPYLRIAFPREVTAADKSVTFELYVPGTGAPFRSVEFTIKDMIVKGKLEI